MRRNLEFDRLVDSYERQGVGSGRTGHRPRPGVYGLFLSAAVLLVIVIIIYFPILFPSSNDNVSHSGLGINYRFQKQNNEIYYAEYNLFNYPGTLWRVNSDSEEKEKIVENGVDLFSLYGDQILYITHSDNYQWTLHTVDINGNGEKVLYQSEKENSFIIKMDAVSGRCYALDSNSHLNIVDFDTGKASTINGDIRDFCIDGEWIYYLKAKDSEQRLYQLWRSDLYGTRNEQLMDGFGSAVDYSDNKIYYINEEDGGLYSVDFSGENEKKIIESEAALYIKVVGEWIYYINVDKIPCIYKVKKNGKQNQKIDDYRMLMGFGIYSTYILDNWLWCCDRNGTNSYYKMIRISDKHDTDKLIEDIIEDMTPTCVIDKLE